MRHPDNPKLKTIVMDGLKNEVISYLSGIGLKRDKEYVIIEKHQLDAHTDTIMIDKYSTDYTLNIQFKALDLSVHCVLIEKAIMEPDSKDEIIKKESIKDLRYNIADETDLSLTEHGRKMWEALFLHYKIIFERLNRDYE